MVLIAKIWNTQRQQQKHIYIHIYMLCRHFFTIFKLQKLPWSSLLREPLPRSCGCQLWQTRRNEVSQSNQKPCTLEALSTFHKSQLEPLSSVRYLWRYRDWLPISEKKKNMQVVLKIITGRLIVKICRSQRPDIPVWAETQVRLAFWVLTCTCSAARFKKLSPLEIAGRRIGAAKNAT